MDTQTTTTCRTLAPEDISPGDYIAALSLTIEYLDVYRDSRHAAPELCRATFIPPKFTPLKVLSVCLPFVLAEDARGETTTLDTRLVGLARLDEDFAKRAMKRTRKESDKLKTD